MTSFKVPQTLWHYQSLTHSSLDTECYGHMIMMPMCAKAISDLGVPT